MYYFLVRNCILISYKFNSKINCFVDGGCVNFMLCFLKYSIGNKKIAYFKIFMLSDKIQKT